MFAALGVFAWQSGSASAVADTCTWVGTASPNWSDGSNWTGCDNSNVPENGDELIFPTSPFGNKTNTNDLVGRSFSRIAIADGYNITGSALIITGKNVSELDETINFTSTGAASTLGVASITLSTPSNGYIRFSNSSTISSPIVVNSGNPYILLTQNGAHATLSGAISGNARVIAVMNEGGSTSNRTLTLSGNNSGFVNGNFVIGSGASVWATDSNSLGASSTGIIVGSGSSLLFNTVPAASFANVMNVSGSGNANDSYGSAIFNIGMSDVTFTGQITLTGDTTFKASNAAGAGLGTGDLIFNNRISGNYNLSVLAMLNTQVVFGGATSNTFGGDLEVLGGAISFGKNGVVPNNLVFATTDSTGNPSIVTSNYPNAISDSGKITLGANDRYELVEPEVIGGLEGTGGLVRFLSAASLTVNQNTDSTYSGNFGAEGVIANFYKNGTGTLTLAGNTADVADDTITYTVNSGTLVINGSLRSTNGGNVVVKSGATLKGGGTVRAVTAESGSSVAIGNSPGCMNMTSLTLNSGSTWQQEINNATACSGYDQAVVTGAVSLGGATLNVTQLAGFAPASGTVLTLINGSSVTGTFAGLADGAVFAVNGINYRINYTSGGDVTLTVVTAAATATTPSTTLADTGTPILPLILVSFAVVLAAFLTLLHRRKAPVSLNTK